MRTIFNFLGPLTNPAGATRQLIGVSDRRFLDIVAGGPGRAGLRPRAGGVQRRRARRAERVGPHPRGRAARRHDRRPTRVTPESVGLRAARRRTRVAAGTPEKNAGIARRVLERRPGRRARPDRAERRRGDLRGRRRRLDRGRRARRRGGDRLRAPRATCWSASWRAHGSWRHERPARGAGRGHARGARAPQARRCRWPSWSAQPPSDARATARSPRRWRAPAPR